jgi:hypothetical protein
MVHPDGTGLEQLTNPPFMEPDDAHYVGSSFSPEFEKHAGAGNDIVAARFPAYGKGGNSEVFSMHIEHYDEIRSVTVNLTKSQTLDDPSWGTHQPVG